MHDAATPPLSHRPWAGLTRAERRIIAGVWLAVGLVLAGYWPLAAVGGWPLATWEQMAGCAAGLAALARPLVVARDRLPWGAIGGAVAVFGLTDAFWAMAGEPELSVADAAYLAANAALLVGVVTLVRGHVVRATGVMLADAAAAALTLAAVGTALVLPPALAGDATGLTLAVNVAYPLWGVALAASVFGAVAFTGWRAGWDVRCLLAGLLVLLTADTAYAVDVAQGALGHVGTLLWPLSYTLIGLAGWLPCRPGTSERDASWRPLIVPGALGVMALAILVVAGLTSVTPAAVALAAAAIVAVFVRSAQQFRDVWALERDLEAAEHLAARDPLTGLLNHRAFQERLTEELTRAARAGDSVALVLLDLDHFAEVNDTHGHQAGDGVLREVAWRIAAVARQEDVVARIGGEEFAWLLPGVDDLTAWDAAERARHAVRTEALPGVGVLTVSGGVVDTRQAKSPQELMRLADGALYWAKAHGRDVVFRYSTEVVRALSADERAAQLTRAQALNAMRVLARAVDARDSYTAQHSERVADMAVRLATALRWPAERIVALREAALVHDVGKIGVPDAILLKEGGLTESERIEVEGHAALGAQIVADVLSDEQSGWVRGHHERYDGAGYPDMLAGADIPDGARILTVADSWDAMTTDRPYRAGLPTDEALMRVVAGRGTQFCPEVVEAMLLLSEAGLLEQALP